MVKKIFFGIFQSRDIFDYFILAGMMIMFSSTFYHLISLGWKSADFTHAYFILPISLWLIWKKRFALNKIKYLSKAGLWLCVAGFLSYLYAQLNEFMFLDALSFVIMMWGIFSIRFDKSSVKAVMFPLSYLVFLVPPPMVVIDTITLPLRTISTLGSYFILKSFHYPAAVYGAILKVGQHELFIADACSGFRSMVTLLALGAIYAYYQHTDLMKKWIIFLSVIPMGIFGNILRIFLTGVISYNFGAKYAEGFFHEFSGILLFIFTVIGLIIVTSIMVKKEVANEED